jgi:hypothetical protein
MGGGGASGTGYPEYLEGNHVNLLQMFNWALNQQDAVIYDIDQELPETPYAGISAHDPSTDIDAMAAAIAVMETVWDNQKTYVDWSDAYDVVKAKLDDLADIDGAVTDVDSAITSLIAFVDALDPECDFETFADVAQDKLDTILDHTWVTNAAAAYAATLDEDIENNVLPKFEGGMRDINAVVSSAFVVGESIIYTNKGKEVARYQAEKDLEMHKMRLASIIDSIKIMMNELLTKAELKAKVVESTTTVLKTYVAMVGGLAGAYNQSIDSYIKTLIMHVEVEKTFSQVYMEKGRLATELNLHADAAALELIDLDDNWIYEKYQRKANIMAAIGGGVTPTKGPQKPNMAASVAGGALSGAAAGAMIGSTAYPVVGTIIGAVVGAAAGYLSAA